MVLVSVPAAALVPTNVVEINAGGWFIYGTVLATGTDAVIVAVYTNPEPGTVDVEVEQVAFEAITFAADAAGMPVWDAYQAA